MTEDARFALWAQAVDVLAVREVERSIFPGRPFTRTDGSVIFGGRAGHNRRAQGRAGGQSENGGEAGE